MINNWFPSNPCANGHVFLWASSYTDTGIPEGMPCRCGDIVYHKEISSPPYLCSCVVFMPADSTVLVCKTCGKPPRNRSVGSVPDYAYY